MNAGLEIGIPSWLQPFDHRVPRIGGNCYPVKCNKAFKAVAACGLKLLDLGGKGLAGSADAGIANHTKILRLTFAPCKLLRLHGRKCGAQTLTYATERELHNSL